VSSHPAGTDRVEDGGADLRGGLREFFVGLEVRPWQVFVRRIPGHGLPAHDATSEPDGACRHEAIGLRRKVVGRNAWRLADVRRLDMHAPPALRPYVADGCRKGGKAVERITELVERERL